MGSLYKKVYLPISIPNGDYCSRCDGTMGAATCSYLEYEGAAILCGLKLGNIYYDNEKMTVRKCQNCLQLKESYILNQQTRKCEITVDAREYIGKYGYDIPEVFSTNAWCVGGEEGIMAIFDSLHIPHCFMIARGDDGFWWLTDECSPYWIPNIIEMYENSYKDLQKLLRKEKKKR